MQQPEEYELVGLMDSWTMTEAMKSINRFIKQQKHHQRKKMNPKTVQKVKFLVQYCCISV